MKANVPASVRQRLLNLARKKGIAYNRIQLLYLQERWLARLAQTPYREHFVLKGGLYLYSNFGLASRPTRDIDFLGRATSSETEQLVQAVTEVGRLGLIDGVHYDLESVAGQEIQAGAEHGGVRIEMDGYLGQARERIRIDIGFGDALPAGPVPLEFPTLLGGEAPLLLAYSFETVIAEKLQAATILYEINTRFKDFYDIHQLASTETFEATALRQAIYATFERRGTQVRDATRLFDPPFGSNQRRQDQWSAFQRRTGDTAPQRFSDVLAIIKDFLSLILDQDNSDRYQWQPHVMRWIKSSSSIDFSS